MLRQAQSMDLAELIEVEKRTGQSSDIVVRLRIPPGAATQAGELRGSRAVRARLERFVAQVTGRSVPPTPGQLDLFSGLDELEGEDEE